MAMNWSYVKAKFSGKPQDPDAHILWVIDWMATHNFAPGQRVQRFLLTLADEARLWHQSIYPFQGNWEELQERLRMQFSKIGNTWEQLCHAWRTFYFDEKTETIGTYAQRI